MKCDVAILIFLRGEIWDWDENGGRRGVVSLTRVVVEVGVSRLVDH